MPSNSNADAKAYDVWQKSWKEMGLTDAEIQYVVAVAKGEVDMVLEWAHPSAKTLELSKQLDWLVTRGRNSTTGGLSSTGSAGSFMHVDVHADGKPYKAAYRAYKTPEDGFKDMARIILGG